MPTADEMLDRLRRANAMLDSFSKEPAHPDLLAGGAFLYPLQTFGKMYEGLVNDFREDRDRIQQSGLPAGQRPEYKKTGFSWSAAFDPNEPHAITDDRGNRLPGENAIKAVRQYRGGREGIAGFGEYKDASEWQQFYRDNPNFLWSDLAADLVQDPFNLLLAGGWLKGAAQGSQTLAKVPLLNRMSVVRRADSATQAARASGMGEAAAQRVGRSVVRDAFGTVPEEPGFMSQLLFNAPGTGASWFRPGLVRNPRWNVYGNRIDAYGRTMDAAELARWDRPGATMPTVSRGLPRLASGTPSDAYAWVGADLAGGHMPAPPAAPRGMPIPPPFRHVGHSASVERDIPCIPFLVP